jgi:hypothetical protein
LRVSVNSTVLKFHKQTKTHISEFHEREPVQHF